MKRRLNRIACLIMALILALMSTVAMAEGEWVCPECGTEGLTTKFCGECGFERPAVVPTEWTCSNCGQTGLTENFCTECGAKKSEAGCLLKPGDRILFGHYEQDGEKGNGAEPILWQVLETEGDMAKLISVYALDERAYTTGISFTSKVTWETCMLRKWLNDYFYNTAFTSREQEKLVTTLVSADWNPESVTDPGNDTLDKVWLLSVPEAERYFMDEDQLICTATSCARRGYYNEWKPCDWWLRTPGGYSYEAAYVRESGWIGEDDQDSTYYIRPVIQIRVTGNEERPAELSIDGDTVTFGHYDQDGDPSNGAEPIEWNVLESDGKTAKLISVKCLDAKAYNDEDEEVTWETCTLRKWLNGDFLNAAFTPEELARLEITEVSADRNPFYVGYDKDGNYYIGTDEALDAYDPDWNYIGLADPQSVVWNEDGRRDFDTDPGRATRDRVWLLSVPEANRYFADNDERVCYPTDTAVQNGALISDTGSCRWWLRSPGYRGDIAARVNRDGTVSRRGDYVYYDDVVVRPVVSLRLS